MKIVYVVEYYFPHVGGVETLFRSFAEGMVQRGHSVVVYTARLSGTPSREVMNGVEILRVPVPGFAQRYFFTFFAPFFIWPKIRGADIVHTTTYNAAIPAWLIAKIFRKPIIISVHEVWLHLWKQLPGVHWFMSLLHKWYENIILHLPYNRIITISQFTKKEIDKLALATPSEVIYPGVDVAVVEKNIERSAVRSELGIIDTDFLLFNYGRPGWAKGIEVAIDAMPMVIKEYPNVKLVLQLSKDPIDRYRALQEKVDQLHLRSNVFFTPSTQREQLRERIVSANAIIVPSRSEGFGFTAIEAAALGAPLICSLAGSLPEVVYGKVGFFTSADPASCAQAIISAIQGKWQEIPTKHYLWSESLQKLETVYSSILATI